MLAAERRGACLWLRLDRPDRRNALPAALWPRLSEVLAEAAADPELRALVVHGAGPCFSVGADLGDFDPDDAAARRRLLEEATAALRAFEELPLTTIAAVHGHCIGGGLELALACDVVVCDESASFQAPEARVGLVPGVLLARGPGRVADRWLRFLALTGEPLDPAIARLAGLVNVVVPPGEHLDEAERLAAAAARCAPLAQATAKAALARGGGPVADAVESGLLLQASADFAEGVAAFRERRKANFRGV